MNTIELTKILSSDPYVKLCFLGVRASNHLPNTVTKLPACLIVNSDPSWKQGSHWLAIYIDTDGQIEFFDSYGKDPANYHLIFNFIKKHAENWKLNVKQLQGPLSSTCGQFCTYFLMWRCRGIAFEKILNNFNQSVDANDIMVVSFVNIVSGHETKVYDIDYVVNQTCKSLFPICDMFTE